MLGRSVLCGISLWMCGKCVCVQSVYECGYYVCEVCGYTV